MRRCQNERKIGEKTYWSSSKAAEYLGASRSTVSKLAIEKRLTNLNQNGTRWFLKEWLDTYINRSTILGNKG